MNIFKFLIGQQEKGNTLITYTGEIITPAKAEAEAKKSYLADIDNNKNVTFEQYKTEWLEFNTVSTEKAGDVICQLFEEDEPTEAETVPYTE